MEKNEKNKSISEIIKFIVNKNNNIFNTIIFITFIIVSCYVGIHHEPWADEAQAWLIARDASVYDIIFNIARYEGSPILWQLLIKFLILLRFQYKYFFLISVFFSSIGIYILLFKLDLNNIYKTFLPFSYFIGYEYTIKARNYCLLLPILAFIAMIYNQRKEHIYLYSLFLILLALTSLYGFILSGLLFLLELFDIIKNICTIKKEKIKISLFKKEIISIIIDLFFYIFIFITLIPRKDIYVPFSIANYNSMGGFYFIMYCGILILEAFVLKFRFVNQYGIISVIILGILLFCVLTSNKKKKIFITLFLIPLFFMICIRICNHHIGLILYFFIFSVYLVRDEMVKKYRKVFCIIFTIVLVTQSYWYFCSSIADIHHDFSASKKVAEYLKGINYKNKKIYASGYYVISILPYFDDNIFYGERAKSTYYTWSRNNGDLLKSSSKEYLYSDIFEENPDIIILDDRAKISKAVEYDKLVDIVKSNKDYSVKHFKASIIFKEYDESVLDKEGFYVFEKIK